jgi:hypothetical protein
LGNKEIGRIMVQTSLGKKRDPHLQNNQSKRAGGVAQVVEHLPSKCKALSSNPKTKKSKRNKRKIKRTGLEVSAAAPDRGSGKTAASYIFYTGCIYFLFKCLGVIDCSSWMIGTCGFIICSVLHFKK